MKCIFCKQGEIFSGEATVTLHRGQTTVIIKAVPAEICENCGEYFLSEQVSRKILKKAEKAVESGVEVEILRFAA